MNHPNELDQQLDNLRTLQQSYDAIAGAAKAYSEGKHSLAAAISAKGVPASAAETVSQMAQKVTQIPQQVNTRTSEFEQIIAPTPYMWNVYSVATDLMKETLPNYFPSYMNSYKLRYGANAFFVGEYYRGYESLELTGADGFLTHDGCFYTIAEGVVTRTAPDGTVTTYAAESIVHTWLIDDNDTYVNRWVAFFYLADGYGFENGNSNICPRRVALCGNCNSFEINGSSRLTDVWVIGQLGLLSGGTSAGSWNNQQVLCNYETHAGISPIYNGTSILSLICPDLKSITGKLLGVNNGTKIKYLSFPKLETISNYALYIPTGDIECDINQLYLPKLKNASVPIISSSGNNSVVCSMFKEVSLPSIEELNVTSNGGGYTVAFSLFKCGQNSGFGAIAKISLPNLKRILSGFIFAYNTGGGYISFRNLIDVEVGELTTSFNCKYWNPITVLADATKKAQLIDNIKNHILTRVSDRTGLSQLTFTISTNMYNSIASETITWNDQEMTLADAFLTKNWLLAGA